MLNFKYYAYTPHFIDLRQPDSYNNNKSLVDIVTKVISFIFMMYVVCICINERKVNKYKKVVADYLSDVDFFLSISLTNSLTSG